MAGMKRFLLCASFLLLVPPAVTAREAPSGGQEETGAGKEEKAAAQTSGEKDSAIPSVAEIVDKANRVSYYQGRDGRARVSMTIIDSQKRKRKREFIILRRDALPEGKTEEEAGDAYCGDQRFYVYFLLPSDVKKMVFMVWKHMDKPDDRWLYLPALDLVKRISSAEKRTSFVGSHFFYEDVSGRNIHDDVHELEKVTKSYFVLENTPRNPKDVEFDSYTVWIHRKTFIPVKTEYFRKGEKYRVYEVLAVKTIQGHPTVTKSRMRDIPSGGETIIEYTDVRYDVGLPEEIFTERYLRRAPTKYLR